MAMLLVDERMRHDSLLRRRSCGLLGGDYSVAPRGMTAMARRYGRGAFGVIHLDTHADAAPALWDSSFHTARPMRTVVENGAIRGPPCAPLRAARLLPRSDDFDWMAPVGMRWRTIDDLHEHGFCACVRSRPKRKFCRRR
jgi:arginase family enzyme